jgi:anion-transporting  ArsA/GET3 family ATPase
MGLISEEFRSHSVLINRQNLGDRATVQVFVSHKVYGHSKYEFTFAKRFKPRAVTKAPPVAMQYEVNSWLVEIGDAPERLV